MKTAADALRQRCRTNGKVSPAAFQALTQPGQPDPKLVELGWNLRQSIDGQETYALTLCEDGYPITAATFTRIGRQMRVSRNGQAEVMPFSYKAIIALNGEIMDKYPDAEWPEPPVGADAIPFQGEPVEQVDNNDIGLQPEW